MTTYKIKILFLFLFTSLLFVQCRDDDDNGNAIIHETCNDGILNGDEVEIDCGGTECPPCSEVELDFGGTYMQVDIAGRPGVNMIFGGTDSYKSDYNVTVPTEREAYQEIFENTLENYFDIYAESLEIPEEDLNYENNIFGWNATKFTEIMAKYDALQVAPEGVTTYYNESGNLLFTGRKLSDDVMDITLMLIFGGEDGTRFDGNNGTPQLTTDGVGVGNHTYLSTFPYLENPLTEE